MLHYLLQAPLTRKSHMLIVGLLQDPRGWSGGAKVLGKLAVPGRPTNFV